MPTPLDPDIDLSDLLEPLPLHADGPARARRTARRRRHLRVVTAVTILLLGFSMVAVVATKGDGEGTSDINVASQPAADLIRNAYAATLGAHSARVSLQEGMSRSSEADAQPGEGDETHPDTNYLAPPPRVGAVDFDTERGWLKADGAGGDPHFAVSASETRYLDRVVYERAPSFTPVSGSGSTSVGPLEVIRAPTPSQATTVPGISIDPSEVASAAVPAPVPPDIAEALADELVKRAHEIPPSSIVSAPPAPQALPPPPPSASGPANGDTVHIRERVASIGGPGLPPTPGKPWTRFDLDSLEGSDVPGASDVAAGVANRFPSKMLEVLKTIGDDVRPLGSEQIRGVDTTHFEGVVNVERPGGDHPLWPDDLMRSMGIDTLPVGVWLDSDGRVRRMTTSFQMPTESGDPSRPTMTITSTLELYDFGTEVLVDAPPDNEVSDVLDQLRIPPAAPPTAIDVLPPPAPATKVPPGN